MEKRVQGRPKRVVGVVGRDKIVEDIRAVLRTRRPVSLSRKELALAIGITPALITYYFPERDQLFEQLTVPVIESHRIKLSGIVKSAGSPEQKLRKAISQLAELYGHDRRLFSIYKKLEDQYPDDYAEVATMTAILSDFFCGWRDTQAPSFEAIVLQGAVFGMCDFAERVAAGEKVQKHHGSATSLIEGSWLDPLIAFFAYGAATGSPCAFPV